MAARGEAQADVEVSTLVVPAWRLRWQAPELALVLGERAVALAAARRDEVDRLRAESLVVFAHNRLGRGVGITNRALDALKAADSAAEHETAWRLRVELASSARAVGAPLTGFAAVRPVLQADGVPYAVRAAALVQASECLVTVGRGDALLRAFVEADDLVSNDPVLDEDTRLLLRGLQKASAAAQHRRWGDVGGAISAAREGLGLLDQMRDRAADSGQVRAELTLELACALMDSEKMRDASEVAAPLLDLPVRAPSANGLGWLRLALATRLHLPAGRVDEARTLLQDAAAAAERHQLDSLHAESLLALAHIHELAGELGDALEALRSAHASERKRARAVYAVRARLAAEFSGVPRQPINLHDQLAVLLGRQYAAPVSAIPAERPEPAADASQGAAAQQQSRSRRPVPLPSAESARAKRGRRAAEDMTVEGLSAARAHAADRWRMVQPFGDDPARSDSAPAAEPPEEQRGGRRRAEDRPAAGAPRSDQQEPSRSEQHQPEQSRAEHTAAPHTLPSHAAPAPAALPPVQQQPAQQQPAQQQPAQRQAAQQPAAQDATTPPQATPQQPGQHQAAQYQAAQHQSAQPQPGQHQSAQPQSGQHQSGQHQSGQHQSGQQPTQHPSAPQQPVQQQPTPQQPVQHRPAPQAEQGRPAPAQNTADGLPPLPPLPFRSDGPATGTLPAIGLIAAAGAVRSGRRRAARESTENPPEGTAETADGPGVLDALKAAGLLQGQRSGGRRRMRDSGDDDTPSTPAEAVAPAPEQRPWPSSTPEPQIERNDASRWRVEAPPHLRADSPASAPEQPVSRPAPFAPAAPEPDEPAMVLPPPPPIPPRADPADAPTTLYPRLGPDGLPLLPALPDTTGPDGPGASGSRTHRVPEAPQWPEPDELPPLPDPVPDVPEPAQIPDVPEPSLVPDVSEPGPVPPAAEPDQELPPPPAAEGTGTADVFDLAPDGKPRVVDIVVGDPAGEQVSLRATKDLTMAELLAEALVAYETGRRSESAFGEQDDESPGGGEVADAVDWLSAVEAAPHSAPVSEITDLPPAAEADRTGSFRPVVPPEGDNETTLPIMRVAEPDPSPFRSWRMPEQWDRTTD
ncbi:tetratricopeptide repeat protein [Umezawaea beigongshangensis]|uniref:tetratricopeptide repeat protein n=1 Tax=Umezawaea beigongshangensis TaxID=2780383 RepID=UPI0018F15E70|nr:tetratricopeptide repeat protein [Umezawaea beigongshangensis]